MKRYFGLQAKRFARVLPAAILTGAILVGMMLLAYGGVLQSYMQDEENSRMRIGIVGTAEDKLLQLGISAISSMDSSRFVFELISMEEPQAERELKAGEIVAYVAFPDGFMESALHGVVPPIQYVSRPAAQGIVSMLKDEIAGMISDIVAAAQKGVYGIYGALHNMNLPNKAATLTADSSIRYVQFILNRAQMYQAENLGISDGLGFSGHLVCGVTVLILLLMAVPFGCVLIEKNLAHSHVSKAKGVGIFTQFSCQFFAYFASFLVLGLGMLTAMHFAGSLPAMEGLPIFNLGDLPRFVPVLFMTAAMSFLFFELATDMVEGILLQFFSSVLLCFFSGCLYPAYFFPESVQKIAGVLPTGLSRAYLEGALGGADNAHLFWGIFAYSLFFCALALLVRRARLLHKGVEI